MSAAENEQSAQVAQALVAFSLEGSFPEETVSSLKLSPQHFPAAIEALTGAKSQLEAEIHVINEETAIDARTWQVNAQSVQDDIARSRALAGDILRKADAPEGSGRAVAEAEARADFLVRELEYNRQVLEILKRVKTIGKLFDRVEEARKERRVLDALHFLKESRTVLDATSLSKSVRVLKLLDIRAFELKSGVHEVFDHSWNTLIHVDAEAGRLSVSTGQTEESMSLSEAVTGLKVFDELRERAEKLWHDLDRAMIAPRMDATAAMIPGIIIEDDALQRSGTADRKIKSLYEDLQQVLLFLKQKLPPPLVEAMSLVMLPEITQRITTSWLDPVVPSSLRDIDDYGTVISLTKDFCDALETLELTGVGDLQGWMEEAPKKWVTRCQGAALDSVRKQLTQGLGAPKQVERVEKHKVSRDDSETLAANGVVDSSYDHGRDVRGYGDDEKVDEKPAAAKGSNYREDEDEGADAWGWGDEDPPVEEAASEAAPAAEEQMAHNDEDEADEQDDAWGWGEDDDTNHVKADAPISTAAAAQPAPCTREMTVKETYTISSMPEPVLGLISAILEDGATLTCDGHAKSVVASEVGRLFGLPTWVLAMFRALSPYYYSLDLGGNMYLYNDATYLAEQLAKFSSDWRLRTDIDVRAKSMLRLDNDIKSLQSFAARAYSNEMSVQKTVIRDLLGGEQNLMQQVEKDSSMQAAVARVRSLAVAWEGILARSAWYQAVGSLIDSVSTKMIGDIMDLPAIGQDEAYVIANLIATVIELDDLFLPSRVHGATGSDEYPQTLQYAPSWLRLQYLSQVLQSNLNDVRYLWMKSELSLHFSATEVVDLINLSFEDNARTREIIRLIERNPTPVTL